MANGDVVDERPPLGAGLIVLGAAQILWGLLSAFGGAWGALTPYTQKAMMQTGQRNPMVELFDANPGFKYLTIAQGAVGAMLGLAFVVGAIGLLMRVAWGRGLSLGAAIVQLVQVVIGTTLTCVLLLPHLLKWMESSDPGLKAAGVGAIGGLGCSVLLSPILPIIVLIVLTRASVRAQFR